MTPATTKFTTKKATSELQLLAERIEGLTEGDSDSLEFIDWKRDVTIAIRHIFVGDDDRHLEEFERIRFSAPFPLAMVIDSSGSDPLPSAVEHAAAYRRGLERVRHLLVSMQREISTHGLEKEPIIERMTKFLISLRGLGIAILAVSTVGLAIFPMLARIFDTIFPAPEFVIFQGDMVKTKHNNQLVETESSGLCVKFQESDGNLEPREFFWNESSPNFKWEPWEAVANIPGVVQRSVCESRWNFCVRNPQLNQRGWYIHLRVHENRKSGTAQFIEPASHNDGASNRYRASGIGPSTDGTCQYQHLHGRRTGRKLMPTRTSLSIAIALTNGRGRPPLRRSPPDQHRPRL